MELNQKQDELSKIFNTNLTLDSPPPQPPQTPPSNDGEEDEESGDEFEFSFFSSDLSSPIAAEEVFKDGQIRIITPISGDTHGGGDNDGETSSSSTTSYDPKVKKVFIVDSDDVTSDVEGEGPYCLWKSPVPEMSQKSNSTGFSRLWKVRDLLARSNSDGKDAFVFLTPKSDENNNKKDNNKKKLKLKVETTSYKGERKEEKKCNRKDNKKKKTVYEELYGGEKNKKGGGKSYLPYRQDLVGFFTNGSSLSRNVHPY